MIGTVKFYRRDRGYGFIAPISGDASADVFFHVTGIRTSSHGGSGSIDKGDEVEFDVKETPKGVAAVNVRITRKAPPLAATAS